MNSVKQDDSVKIPWRVRADLQTVRLQFDGRAAWGIKDPMNLSYYEISDEAFFVLNQLDGKRSAEEICRSFHDRFRPRTLSAEEVRGFLGQLIGQNLLTSEGWGYGPMMVARQKKRRTWQSWMALPNLLAIRFQGVDPDRFFGAILPWTNWLFSPVTLAFEFVLILAAILLVTVQFDELLARLPDTQALLSTSNLIGMSVSLAAVKIVHEFGHGLTCKRFGGECHEMGVMLLVFTPTLYCNVSDIWMINDKWRRIAVSLAGIWIEIVIASICTLLWWFSAPGLFQSLCLNLMFLCGIGTIAFNGNPLLRYDGYFVLSDWLEIPNLQQQSVGLVRSRLVSWFCGIDSPDADNVSFSRRWGLFAFGVASSAYRVMLTVLIGWGLYRWLKPLGFGAFAQIFVTLTISLMILTPILQFSRFLRNPENRAQIKWPRFLFRSAIALALAILVFELPLPCHVIAGALADDDTTQRVYVTTSGTLVDAVTIGEHVERGQVIARLLEPRLEAAVIQLEGEVNQQRVRLDQLERRRVNDPNVAQVIPTIKEAVKDLEEQLAQRQRDAERLVLKSPRSGTVLPISSVRWTLKAGALAHWSGSPLEQRNRGCFLRSGTTVCSVGSDLVQSATIIIHQDDLNLVRAGQRVRVLWSELAGEIQEGEIVELAAFDAESLSREAVIKLNLPARINAAGVVQTVGTWYQAKIKLKPSALPVLHGSAGIAKIVVDTQSIATGVSRWLARTFPM